MPSFFNGIFGHKPSRGRTFNSASLLLLVGGGGGNYLYMT